MGLGEERERKQNGRSWMWREERRGGTEEFIKNNIKMGGERENRQREKQSQKQRVEKKKKEKSLHDSSYRFPLTVGVVKAG